MRDQRRPRPLKSGHAYTGNVKCILSHDHPTTNMCYRTSGAASKKAQLSRGAAAVSHAAQVWCWRALVMGRFH